MPRRSAQASGPHVLDFTASVVDDGGVAVTRKMVLSGTVLRYGGAFPAPRHGREVVVFRSFLMAGLAPPLSPFLVAVLEDFALHLVHLTPKAILTLALFAHACEMFVGLRPLVELFRHFFAPCWLGSISTGPDTAR